MSLTVKEIADLLGGEVVGNPDTMIHSPARIEYGKKGNICFYANPKYEKYVYSSKASAFLVNRSFEPKEAIEAELIKVDDAYAAVPELLRIFSEIKKSRKRGNRLSQIFICGIKVGPGSIGKNTFIGRYTVVEKGTKIGRDCNIYPQVYIGENVTIGDNAIIYPGVRIYHGCVIGNNCILHSNSVIGADGFGFAPCDDGTFKKIPQTGNVIIEDNVEIGANTTIDRATMGSTIVRKGVKIDNLCQIGHNVEVGENTVMAAMSGVAGSTKIGHNCMFGGQAGINGHITIPPHTTAGGGAVVTRAPKKEGEVLIGYPAIDHREYMRAYAIFRQNGKKG